MHYALIFIGSMYILAIIVQMSAYVAVDKRAGAEKAKATDEPELLSGHLGNL